MDECVIATIMRPEGDTGVQTHFNTFSSWRRKSGFPVSVVTPFDAPLFIVFPIFSIRFFLRLFTRAGSVWWYRFWHKKMLELALRKYLSKKGACVIYAQCPLSASAAMAARSTHSQKVVLVVHFNISQADEWAGKGEISHNGVYAKRIRKFESKVVTSVNGLVFVSNFMRQQLIARVPEISSVPFLVAPNFLADPGGAQETMEIWADFLIVGTLEPRKNQRYALEIIAAAAQRGKKFTLTVAGDGPDRNELEEISRQLNIADQVRFLGYVRNAADLFRHHKACLHTARIENLPLTIIEAFSRGIPVFCGAVGGIPEVVTDRQEGVIIPLDDAEVAAELIIEFFCSSADFIAVAGRRARERFVSGFQCEVVAGRVNDFICNLQSQ